MSETFSVNERFRALADSYYTAWFRYHPDAAVEVGVAGYAHLLAPVGEEARGALICLNDEMRTALEEVPRAELDADAMVDYDLLAGAVAVENQFLIDIEPNRVDPARYLPVHAIYQLTIREVDGFADALTRRLEAIPQSLAAARAWVAERSAAVPALWASSAIRTARAGVGFLQSLPTHPKIIAAGGIAGLETRLHKAARALQDYSDFVEVELLPTAKGEFACGERYFTSLLRWRHGLDVSPDVLRAFGEELAARTGAELRAACRELAGTEELAVVLDKVRAEHPRAEELLSVYRREMESARAFVVKHALVSVPERESLEVVETPVFLRHQIPFAAYCEPLPNDPEQRGFYYVTPPTDAAELAEHDTAGLMHTCVHEAWPGHHLQFVTANRNPVARSLPRLLNASATLYEGWALYSEQLMHEQGFLNRPEQRVLLLRDRLWRALRIVIDVDIHTRGVTAETAAERLVTQLGFAPAQAMAELTWYTRAPTVPLGYATGWALINALRAGMQRHKGFSLRDFHDRLLSQGSIPLPKAIERAFGQEAWQQARGGVFQ